MPVVEEGSDEPLATVDRILLNPDTAAIEGFFVLVPGFFTTEERFIACSDIQRFGKRVEVRDHSILAPADDHIRLRPLLHDSRTVLGQRIVTESGRRLGRCRDVQFNTQLFRLEWLFPCRFGFLWGDALPVRCVTEIRPDAIVIRDQQKIVDEISPAELIAQTTPTAA